MIHPRGVSGLHPDPAPTPTAQDVFRNVAFQRRKARVDKISERKLTTVCARIDCKDVQRASANAISDCAAVHDLREAASCGIWRGPRLEVAPFSPPALEAKT